MRLRRNRFAVLVCAATTLAALAASPGPAVSAATADEPPLVPVPKAECGPGSSPETDLQGRVSLADVQSGRAAQGYRCNAELVGQETTPIPLGSFGGFKVLRYVDPAGHECAFYDLQLLVGTGILDISKTLNAGVAVLDMSDPAHPKRTATLRSVAMLTPHESLVLNSERGLLAAVAGTPLVGPGIVDLYDIKSDCRRPKLLSLPNLGGVIGHESGMSPDGRTFYSGNPTGTLAAVDIEKPRLPKTLWIGPHASHGLSVSDDGNRVYATNIYPTPGIRILDVSEVNSRAKPPRVQQISELTWKGVTIPQITIPVTIDGHPYLIEVDEYGALGLLKPLSPVPGVARIIDIGDEKNPRVISNIRLEVHDEKNFPALRRDPGAANPVGGYAGHYCAVPRRADPGIVACSMLLSGLRVFDIRDPFQPREIAYFNQPASVSPNLGALVLPPSWAQSAPDFVPERCEVWYSDGRTGFYNVRLTNSACPFPGS